MLSPHRTGLQLLGEKWYNDKGPHTCGGKPHLIEIIYGVVCAAMLLVILFLCGYSVHALWLAGRTPESKGKSEWPKVALVVPCKGLDLNLEENLRRHFHHDYPDYTIVFTVADASDPACAIIQKLIQTEKGPSGSLVVAPRLPDCVEKVSNQLAAFQSLSPGVQVIVCARLRWAGL